jgi:hypothetical protein
MYSCHPSGWPVVEECSEVVAEVCSSCLGIFEDAFSTAWVIWDQRVNYGVVKGWAYGLILRVSPNIWL